jgi:cellulose synthase/poly-beta-1,6-N-acetylglucosamine synthase-like glycosyltransferase
MMLATRPEAFTALGEGSRHAQLAGLEHLEHIASQQAAAAVAAVRPVLPAYTGPETGDQITLLDAEIDAFLADKLQDAFLPPHQQVTVLIPAHNEAASIAETIRSLRRQTIPPASITVVCDNCTDRTAEIALSMGVRVMTSVGNKARKAGALNQALSRMLPGMGPDDLVLIMDADSELSSTWIADALTALTADERLGGVCGTYLGLNDRGILRQLQRNEFVRASRLVPRRAALWVLSGTGTMLRVRVLREVARQRGRSFPGTPGEFYNSLSITEDYEITLALKSLGWRCIAPPGCTASTEIMPTWTALFRQRLRWQSGTLTALRNYGITPVTWGNWAREVFFYLRYFAQVACWTIIGTSLAVHPSLHMPPWVVGMLGLIYAERVITVRKAGWKGILLAALLLPEWIYGMFDGLYLMQALFHEFTGGDLSWGHLEGTNA